MAAADDVASDVELLARVAARDVSAVGALYDRHSRVLFSLIHRIVRNAADAEDVLQEVLLRVWEKAESYDSALGSPMAWLVRIARNRAIDRVRSRQAAPVTQPADETPSAQLETGGPPRTPERMLRASEEQRALAAALERLMPEQRVLIEQAFLMGYTQSELAERFGLPLGTVKTRIRTGMLAMREHLQHLV